MTLRVTELVLTAKAWHDKGEPEKAKQLLLANLESIQLTPASDEWRDSLSRFRYVIT